MRSVVPMRPWLPVVVLLAVLAGALPGCSRSTGTRQPATATAPAPSGGSPADISASPASPDSAVAPVAPALPPTSLAGSLATATAGGTAATTFQAWFAGVLLGEEGGRLIVAYPAMSASSNGTRTVAHAKVALFRCTGRSPDGTANYTGCTRRAVEYGELAGAAARLVRSPDGSVSLAGRFPTYTYGGSVDRDPRVAPRWTGRAYLIRVDLQPAGGGELDGTVTLGGGPDAVTATLDTGYPNRIQLPAAPHRLRWAGRAAR